MNATYLKDIASTLIAGVDPAAPVITNSNGGKQSDTPYGFHLLPPSALFDAAEVAKYGADKYGETFSERNYTKIDTIDHLNHAIQHIYAFLAGDKQDDHQCLLANLDDHIARHRLIPSAST